MYVGMNVSSVRLHNASVKAVGVVFLFANKRTTPVITEVIFFKNKRFRLCSGYSRCHMSCMLVSHADICMYLHLCVR